MKFSTTVVALASVGAVQAAHVPDCMAFCADAATACTGTAFPFTDAADCKAKCDGWKMNKPGLPSTTDAEKQAAGLALTYTNAGTDTFFCRQYHLSVAKTDSTHCPHIADVSTGVCDKPECDVFCTDYTATCGGTTGGTTYYENKAACQTDCTKMFTENRRGPEYGRAGNTYGCRRYHLDVAMTATAGAKATHCPHAGPTGGDVCVDNPANFCSLFTKACVEAKTPVENLVPYTNCATQFTAFDGTMDNGMMMTTGDSRACRQYHLNVAYSTFDTTHCLHAQADGGGVCVAPPAAPTPAADSSATRSFAGVAAVASLAVALLV